MYIFLQISHHIRVCNLHKIHSPFTYHITPNATISAIKTSKFILYHSHAVSTKQDLPLIDKKSSHSSKKIAMSMMTDIAIFFLNRKLLIMWCYATKNCFCNSCRAKPAFCFFFCLKNRVVAALYSEDTSTKYAFLEFVTKIFFCVFTICISIFFLNSFGISIFFQLFLERFTR